MFSSVDDIKEYLLKQKRLFETNSYSFIEKLLALVQATPEQKRELIKWCSENEIKLTKSDGRTNKSKESMKYKSKEGVKGSRQTYLDDIGQYGLLTKEEEVELGKKAHEGDFEAITILVKCNLKLVVTIARKFKESAIGYGVSFEDVIQFGNIGLWNAAKNYVPTDRAKFSTYAALYIKQSIHRGISASQVGYRLPTYIYERIHLMKRLENQFISIYERAPTEEELVEILNEHEQSKESNNKQTYTIDMIREYKVYDKRATSMDLPVGNKKKNEGQNTTLGDFFEDKSNNAPEIENDQKFLHNEFEKAISKLSEPEQTYLNNMLAPECEQKTSRQIAKEIKIPYQKINEFAIMAIKHLKEAINNPDMLKQIYARLMEREYGNEVDDIEE